MVIFETLDELIDYLKRMHDIQVYGLRESLSYEFKKQESCRYVPTHKELIKNRYSYFFNFDFRKNNGDKIIFQITGFIVMIEEATEDCDAITELFYALNKNILIPYK